jgi:hypothetical protein
LSANVGLEPDPKKSATAFPAKPVDWRDLVVVADALGLVSWQYEDRQNLSSSISSAQSPYCDGPTPGQGGGFRGCPVDWTASRSGSDVVRYDAYFNGFLVAFYEEGRSVNITKRSRDRGRADSDAQNDENAVKNSIRSSLGQTKSNLQADFLGRGDSWKKLQIAVTGPPPPPPADQAAKNAGAFISELHRISHDSKSQTRSSIGSKDLSGITSTIGSIVKWLAQATPRNMLPLAIENTRAQIYAAHAKEAVALPPGTVAQLNDLYVKIKVPLLVKYGTCGPLNPHLLAILDGLESGDKYSQSIANASWAERVLPMLRTSQIDAISLETEGDLSQETLDSLGPSGLFDAALSDFTNREKYRTCDFGLPTLNAGLTLIERYVGLPH